MKGDDPLLIEIIKEFLETNGIYKTKLRILRQYVQSKLPDAVTAPCESTLSKILRETFHQYYRKDHAANTKYRDQVYNNKRIWIARLVTQFLYDKVIVVSIDESNIRSDALNGKQW